MGSGMSTYRVIVGLMDTITEITKINKAIRLMVYITAGPKYMRTWLTSSLILFIKSPVLLRL